MMRAFCIFGITTFLLQTGTNEPVQGGGCLADVGLFPGFAGPVVPGVGVGGVPNPIPGIPGGLPALLDPTNMYSPEYSPGTTETTTTITTNPTIPTTPTTTTGSTASIYLVVDNQASAPIVTEFLIDGIPYSIRTDPQELTVLDLLVCVEEIDLQRVTLLISTSGTGTGTSGTGGINLFNNPAQSFVTDRALDWPGILGTLNCGDVIMYTFTNNINADPVTQKIDNVPVDMLPEEEPTQ